MSAIRIVIAGILAIMAALAPQISKAKENSVIIFPLADYSIMDTLTTARHQDKITQDALTEAVKAKGFTATNQGDVFSADQKDQTA